MRIRMPSGGEAKLKPRSRRSTPMLLKLCLCDLLTVMAKQSRTGNWRRRMILRIRGKKDAEWRRSELARSGD